MRSTFGTATVRLYRLVDAVGGGGEAETLLYGPLDEALILAASLPEHVQEDLFLATDNDVVAYLDLAPD
ncbi:hypothetical protein ACFOON_09910 [Novosphingobium piscinae]|uniref:Uncharacterized protein n=1 Tax=Novosphingobium piscinae TaxID=1507448 RepID=A0A7X1KR09_9SPHN|nr:hypothetical protein [Novosphingobium piscinae]MBC2670170.1 hypothetical protein [Novosphingobium piscinae]